MKTSVEIQKMYQALAKIGEETQATACKDISNPGLIGTLAMMLEVSGVGARVEINNIPLPVGVNLEDWLLVHPATAFIFTTSPETENEILNCFEEVGMTAAAIGRIAENRKLTIHDENNSTTVFDFKTDVVTGITVR